MFVPPDQRSPAPPPRQPPPRRELTPREQAVLPWIIAFIAVTIVLAPIGGSTVLEAVWYLLSKGRGGAASR